jgi:hypothetical protein
MTTLTPATTPTTPATNPPAVDLYRDIHKGIRTELFAVMELAGRTDGADPSDRAALADHVRAVHEVLEIHAKKEDTHLDPVLREHLPELAEHIEADHHALEARFEGIAELAAALLDPTAASMRAEVHHLYLELSAFSGTYLLHQDEEERVVMPAVAAALGPEAVLALHQQIVGSIPPDEMARSLAMMLPAMNIDDRTEMLGGMRQGAPAEVFDGVWSLAASVLAPADHAALGARLGL